MAIDPVTELTESIVDLRRRLDAVERAVTRGAADLLDGQHGSYYQNAGNLNAGTLPAARLSGAYSVGALTATGYTVGSRAGRLATAVGSAAASGALSLTTQTTPTDITGASATLNGLVASDVVFVSGTWDVELPSTGQNTVVVGVLNVGGTPQSAQGLLKAFQTSGTLNVRTTMQQTWVVTGVSGNVVFKLQAYLTSSVLATITVNTTHTKLDYIVLSSA